MKKTLSLILALVMIFAMMATGVSALAEEPNVEENVPEENIPEENKEEVKEELLEAPMLLGTPGVASPAALTVRVVDGNQSGIKGAAVALFVGTEVKYSAVTDANGNASFSIDAAGSYTLKQTAAAEHYIADSGEYAVSVTGASGMSGLVLSANPSSMTLVNQACGDLVVKCIVSNAKSTGLEITSYPFAVTIGGSTKYLKLTNGETATFSNIPYGTAYSVSIDRTGATWNNEITNYSGSVGAQSTELPFTCRYEYSETGTPITMKVCTISAKDSSKLEGAKYTIYKDSSLSTSLGTATSDGDGMIQVKFTTVGTYYMKQVAATTGYTKSSATYAINITESGAYTTKTETVGSTTTIYIIPVLGIGINSLAADGNGVFYIKNAATSSASGSSTSPQTGDSGELLFWSAALIVTAVAGASGIYMLRRKEN